MKKLGTFLKKNIITILGTLISLGLVVYFCVTTGIDTFVQSFSKLSPLWLVAALVAMFFYWLFEALSLHVLIHHIYPKRRFLRSFRIAMVGQLYNAITPFASGGQPMQLYEMTVNDGMSMGSASSVMTRKCLVFQSGVTLFSLLALVYAYSFFAQNISGFLVVTSLGLLLNLIYLGALLLLSYNRKLTNKLTNGFVKVFTKLRLIKNPQTIHERVNNQLQLFHESSTMFSTAKPVVALSYFLTFLQLCCYFLIPYCVYRAFGLVGAPVFMMVSAAAYVYMISSFMPLPGGSGAAESSFYMLFLLFFSNSVIAPAMLLWRTITYYSCLIAGAATMAAVKDKKKGVATD
ncbi:MAG: lysylphosphatidylglycerol synthase transmembrane domain-containing protein [Christensenellales bacterium]